MLYLLLALGLIILILAVLIVITDVTIYLRFKGSPGMQVSAIKILIFKSIKVYEKKVVYKGNARKDKEIDAKRVEKVIEVISKSFDTIKSYNNFLKDVNLRLGKGLKSANVRFSTSIGTGDAASTGLLCGIVWAILGTLRMERSYSKMFRDTYFSVNPNYQKKIFTIDIDSIFAIKTAYIIYIFVLLNELFNLEEERVETNKETG